MSRGLLVLSTVVAGAIVAPGVAYAQTASSGPSITATSQANPTRLIPDKSANICGGSPSDTSCVSTRAANLTPLGVSYADCMADQWLRFSVVLNGFSGGYNVSVWASVTSDCTNLSDRGGPPSVAATCWQLNTGVTNPVYNTPTTVQFDVRVQDIVGHQQHPPFPAVYTPVGSEGCLTQTTPVAVPMYVDFVITDPQNSGQSGSYQFNLGTDLVGPPAPIGVGTTAGDTLLNVSWTANSDADTQGYDLFIDPIPGQEYGEGGNSSGGGQVTVCPDTGAPIPEASDESGDDGSGLESSTEASVAEASASDSSTSDGATDGAATEASTPAPASDAGCKVINTGGVSRDAAPSVCYSPVLGLGTTEEGGTVVQLESSTTVDESGVASEAGTVIEGAGGISGVPVQYGINTGSGNSVTIADKSVGNYVIKGLIDGVTYNVVVAAVDGYGNVGPSSTVTCNYPAQIQDFWQTYEQDGGGAGGFCALNVVGGGGTSLATVGGLVAVAALVRRRRRGGAR